MDIIRTVYYIHRPKLMKLNFVIKRKFFIFIPVQGHKTHKAEPCTPGWTEYVESVRNESLFWHSPWNDCGRPRSGVVAGYYEAHSCGVSLCHLGPVAHT